MAAWVVTVVTGVKVMETAAVTEVRALTRNWDLGRSDRKFLYTQRNLMPTSGTSQCHHHRNRHNQRQICSTRLRPQGERGNRFLHQF